MPCWSKVEIPLPGPIDESNSLINAGKIRNENYEIRIKSEMPLKNVQFCSSSRKAKILTTDIHLVFRGLKSESDAEIGQNGTFFKGISVDIHICIVTHAIPNPFGITVFTMIVLTVKKSVFVVNGFIFTHPYPTVCTVYILNIFFLHEKIDSAYFMKNFYEISGLGLCMGSP